MCPARRLSRIGRPSLTTVTLIAVALVLAVPAVAGAVTTVYAVGDGDGSAKSKALASYIAARDPERFFYLGDVYEKGTLADFESNYETAFGSLASVTDPVIGNHEHANVASGYYPYWTTKRPGWSDSTARHRAYVTPEGWQVIAYSSEHQAADRAAGRTSERDWVAAQLAEHSGTCRIVLGHKGRFSAADTSGGDDGSQGPIWNAIRNKTALNVVAHRHVYGRLAPIEGVTVITAGLGGHGTKVLGPQPHTVAASVSSTPTVLKLTLRPGAADFEARTAANVLKDSGTIACAPAGSGRPAPTASFVASPTSGAAPLSVGFIDTSTGSPTAWAWDFDGDGTTDSTDRHATHVYEEPGTYTARLTASNATGSDVEVETDHIIVTSGGRDSVTFTPVADAPVRSTNPASNYAATTELRVRRGTASSPGDYRSYVKFDVAGLSAPPRSATLRLWVADASPDGGDVFGVHSLWTESAITWNTAPVLGDLPLGSLGVTTAGTWAIADVTSAITGDGPVTFALSSASSNSAIYSSREAANNPQLVIAP